MARVLEIAAEQAPALTVALARERDHFLAVAAEPGQLPEDRDDAIRSVSLAASWLADLPRLVVADDAADHLAALLEHYATTAARSHAFADASTLLALRAELEPDRSGSAT